MTAASRRARADLVRGRRAGLVSRVLADGIDVLVSVAILFGVLVGFAVVRYMVGSEPLVLPRVSGIFTAAALPVTAWLYLSLAWSAGGRSVGKKLVGLRVVCAGGSAVGLVRATSRALICVTFGLVSMAWVAFSSRNAAVHDLLLRTAVVYDWSDEVRTPLEALPIPAIVAVRVEVEP